MLLQGHEISDDLGGMVVIGEPVVHRHTAEFRQRFHHLLVIAPVLDAVKEPAQHLGGVLHGFLFAHLGAAGLQERYVATLIVYRHLKGTAGAGGRFLKQQGNVLSPKAAAQYAAALFRLQIVPQIQKIANLPGGKIHQC